MTAVAPTIELEEIRTPQEIKRSRYLGITYIAMAIFVLWAFAFGSVGNGSATFGLARPTDPSFPDFTFNAAFVAFIVAAVLASMGGVQLARGFGKRSNLVLAFGFILFTFAFLGWATAQSGLGSFSMVGMFETTIVRSVPITLGALAGVLCERVAIINIAIEGMLLGGAFVAVLVASLLRTEDASLYFGAPMAGWIGVAAAMATGAVLSWVLAVFSVRYRVDQIIVGVVINIFVLGLTSFLTVRLLVTNPDLNSGAIFKSVKIWVVGDIPVIGPIFFNQTAIVYLTFILVAALTFALFRTRWGLRSRAVGEHPQAADTVGVNVYRFRYLNVMMGGMVAGIGGAWFTVGTVGRFDENMTNGKGFIGLAAMIFGRWHPVGAMSAGLVFGFADALRQKLGILQTPIPSEFLGMLPFLATILVVAGLVGKARPPAADGQPYIKE
ncbi:MAG: ABC transporter permease [Acidimicrobiia bacterium]|nr:ABC transporter permease [Acidimicrobiia bacterium]